MKWCDTEIIQNRDGVWRIAYPGGSYGHAIYAEDMRNWYIARQAQIVFEATEKLKLLISTELQEET